MLLPELSQKIKQRIIAIIGSDIGDRVCTHAPSHASTKAFVELALGPERITGPSERTPDYHSAVRTNS